MHDVLNIRLSVDLAKSALHGCVAMWEAVDHFESERGVGAGGTVGEEISGRILIIDDDPHFLRVLQRILSGEKFLVTATSNPCDAIGLVRSSNFNLIICDLRMPDCDGLNLLQAIRNTGNEIPVIILTAYGEVDTYLEAMNAGATEYLNKPIKSDELVLVVRNCLRRGNHRHNDKPPKSV
ncbi:MAG TPA: response regulator [Terriglobia bacterium]|nr:response regulator [Terriglobia bacterium]